MHSSKGILYYSPKKAGSQTEANWWLVVNCDPEIGRYYRTLMNMHTVPILDKPMWGAHISVICNEEPPENKKPLWKKYDGLEVEFWHTSQIDSGYGYWWLDVHCPFLEQVRLELGLPRFPEFGFHLTIGNHLK